MLTFDFIKNAIKPICKEYGVKRAYIFGSYARGEANKDSDIDLRVIKGKNQKLNSLVKSSLFVSDLEETLGKKVDLITVLPNDKNFGIFRQNVLNDEVLVYDSAAN